MRFFIYPILGAFLFYCPLFADDVSRSNLTADVVAAPTTIAVAGTITTVIDIGASEIQGIDWVMTSSATLNVQVQLRSSNAFAGPFDYATSLTNTNTTTTFTIIDGTNATDLRICPTRYVQVKLVNNGAASATVSRMTMFKY